MTGPGRAVHDQVLGLLEAEARELADDLDHLDLLVAHGRQDHVELGLLLFGGRRAAAARRPPGARPSRAPRRSRPIPPPAL